MYTIRYAAAAADDLRRIAAYYRRTILTEIPKQLRQTPTVPSKRRKRLPNLVVPWEAVLPIWELRVGAHRVFYDVSEVDQIVVVRAIRHKPPSKRTEDIL